MSPARAAYSPSVGLSADCPDRRSAVDVLAARAFRTEVAANGAVVMRVNAAAAAIVFDELTPAVLIEAGVRRILVDGHAVLSPRLAIATLAFVRFLRDASAAGVAVTWRGTIDPDLDIRQLRHLSPPLADPSQDCRPPEEEWRRDYQVGLFYYRIGPGCVLITDRRAGSPHRNVVLRSRRHLQAVTSLLVPGAAPGSGDPMHAAYQDLLQAGLILRLGDNAVVLPHRLACRPVPWSVF